MVLLQEADNLFPHPVVARLADKRGVQARTPEGDEAIEHRTTRHCTDGLIVLEDDIENRLAYTYYLTHCFMIYGCKDTNKLRIKN